MAKNYCIMSIQKVKSMGGLQKRYEHNFRLVEVPNASFDDFTKNEELIDDSGLNYKELWYQRIKREEIRTGSPVAVRKNSVLAYEIVTTFSKDAEIDIDKWKQLNIEWMQSTFGIENVISMQLHRDEECEHIHTIVVPIDEKGHLCAKSFTGTRGQMFNLHTSYAKAMEPLGLERGEIHSRAKKEDLHRFYTSVNKAASMKVPTMEPGERVDEYVDRVNDFLQTRELMHLNEKKKLERKLAVAETKNVQLKTTYKDAIHFYDFLFQLFHGDEKAVKKRIKMYTDIEESVPRKTLSSLLENILIKFPKMENIRKVITGNKNSSVDTNR